MNRPQRSRSPLIYPWPQDRTDLREKLQLGTAVRRVEDGWFDILTTIRYQMGVACNRTILPVSQKPGESPGRHGLPSLTFLSLFLAMIAVLLRGQGAANPPSRWQAKYTQIYLEDFEGNHTGIQLVSSGIPPGQINSSVLTTDLSLVIAGKASARIGWYGKLVTVPAVVPLTGNATYIVEFQYRI